MEECKILPEKWKDLILRYKKWVLQNPDRVIEMETAVKWSSYLLAGRFNNSEILCEFIYSGSRLFEMLNDFIVRNKCTHLSIIRESRLKILITVVENLEVVLEISALKLWGDTGRWIIITIIQLIKAVWRVLILKRSSEMTMTPPVKPLNRRKGMTIERPNQLRNGFNFIPEKNYIKLAHSGKVLRSLCGSMPHHLRSFSPPEPIEDYDKKTNFVHKLTKTQMFAEVLHILRPVIHLSAMYMYGKKSWAPYFLSLCTDVTSLKLHKKSILTPEEKSELLRRRLNLVYYLIRSPLFHKATHRQINFFLNSVARHVPFGKSLCKPLLDYIPKWQKVYAYTWS